MTGLLIPAQNTDALAGAILQLLRDPALAKRMGEEGRRYVTAKFSFERLVRETDDLYTELLGEKN